MRDFRVIFFLFHLFFISIVHGQLEKGLYVGRELDLLPGQITSLKDNNGIERLDFKNSPSYEIKIYVSDSTIEIHKKQNVNNKFDSAIEYIYDVFQEKVSTNINGQKYLFGYLKKCLNCSKVEGDAVPKYVNVVYFIHFENNQIFLETENTQQKILLTRQKLPTTAHLR